MTVLRFQQIECQKQVEYLVFRITMIKMLMNSKVKLEIPYSKIIRKVLKVYLDLVIQALWVILMININ